MQLQNSGLTLDISNKNVQQIEFDVDKENLGLILETLRSKMYADPILAICREVASNSRDANREAGNLAPTEILCLNNSLWTENKPVIIFKDKGPGISPQRIADVFVKFGASTKRHTNNLTGGFGYGAKTPFAYSDTFYIKTVVDKTEYVYVCALDESRRGKLILLTEVKTTETNGTEIIVPLQEKDIRKFKTDILFSTFFWDVRPIYKGFDQELVALKDPIVFENNNEYYLGKSFQNFKGVYALIDGIPYALANTNFKTHNLGYKKDEHLVLLKFNNGQLPVSTNRETIIVNDVSQTLISSRAESMLKHYSNMLSTRLDALEKAKDEHGMLFEFKNILAGKSTQVFEIFNRAFSYKKDVNKLFILNTKFETLKPKYNVGYLRTSYGTFKDFMWQNDDTSKVNFYLANIPTYPLKTKALVLSNSRFAIVDYPSTKYSDVFTPQVAAMNATDFEAWHRAQGWGFCSKDVFIEKVKDEALSKQNFKIFCDIYKPQLISTVANHKTVRQAKAKTTTVGISSYVFEPGKDQYSAELVLDVTKNQLLNKEGKNVDAYFMLIKSTAKRFHDETYYIRKFGARTLPFNKTLVLLNVSNQQIEKALSKCTSLHILKTQNDFDAIVDANKIMNYYLACFWNEHSKSELNWITKSNEYFGFLTAAEHATLQIADKKHSGMAFINARGILINWNEYQEQAKKLYSQESKSIQCIIEKYKGFSVINTNNLHTISKEKLLKIKQILLT